MEVNIPCLVLGHTRPHVVHHAAYGLVPSDSSSLGMRFGVLTTLFDACELGVLWLARESVSELVWTCFYFPDSGADRLYRYHVHGGQIPQMPSMLTVWQSRPCRCMEARSCELCVGMSWPRTRMLALFILLYLGQIFSTGSYTSASRFLRPQNLASSTRRCDACTMIRSHTSHETFHL